MNKKIFLVSALVVMAMSAMFVSCKKDSKDNPTNGCECTYTWDGEEVSGKYTLDKMKEQGLTTCTALEKNMVEKGADSASCTAY